jgi:PleD family two-component response regulator
MFSMTVNDFILTMGIALLVAGLVFLGIGAYVLVKKLLGRDLQNISEQTTKLAQKGLTDDITGLVGNARSLIEALNDLVKTTAGVGILLLMLGIVLLSGAYVLVLQIR